MRKLFILFSLAAMLFSGFVDAQVYVKGYTRKDGTYVKGHYRSSPNNTVRDNYSYKGNVNPYTGKVGTNYYKNDPSSAYYERSVSPYTYNTKRYTLSARKTLELTLSNKGFRPGPVDGYIDKKTILAIKRAQIKYNLRADGKAGPNTVEKLGLITN